MTGIEQAIELAGGQAELGAMLNPAVSQQAIAKMKANGFAPLDRAEEIHALFTRIALRDLVGPKLKALMSL